jgi:hypothetical protein
MTVAPEVDPETGSPFHSVYNHLGGFSAYQSICFYLCLTLDAESFCPPGMTYSCSTNACSATCMDPYAPEVCPFPEKDTCVCPVGQLFHNGSCTSCCLADCLGSNEQQHQVCTTEVGRFCFSFQNAVHSLMALKVYD